MAKKNKNRSGVVYSTNPDFDYSQQEDSNDAEELAPDKQTLRIFLDRKLRKGKEVTLISGFIGPEENLRKLGKFLKTKCGAGGSVKEGEIIVQGNHRDKVLQLLLDKGFSKTKKAGG